MRNRFREKQRGEWKDTEAQRGASGGEGAVGAAALRA